MLETARTPFDETADNLSAMVLAITTHQTIQSEKETAAPEQIEVALLLYTLSQTPAEA